VLLAPAYPIDQEQNRGHCEPLDRIADVPLHAQSRRPPLPQITGGLRGIKQQQVLEGRDHQPRRDGFGLHALDGLGPVHGAVDRRPQDQAG